MSCLSFTKIPEMTCGPDYSIRRLPTALPTSLDTTNLSGLYAYTSKDFGAVWRYVPYSVGGAEAVDRDPAPCDCASDVSKDEYTYISWLKSCTDLADNGTEREWIIEPVCSDSSKTYPAPVAYATNRPTFMPTPVFNPNQAVSGGSDSGAISGSSFLGRVVEYVDDNHVKVVRLAADLSSGALFEYPHNLGDLDDDGKIIAKV